MSDIVDDGLDGRLAAIAQQLAAEDTPESTADRLTTLALELVRGASDAGVSLVRGRGRVETVAPTSDLVAWADDLQHELSEGPCVDALHADEVDVPDLAADPRWPSWRPDVVGKGVRSMFCVQLALADRELGALNLYATEPEAFDEADRIAARHLASHAAIAIASARERSTLQEALATRTVIGQAEGLLMERFGGDADQAFGVLVRYSQHRNEKLAVVASEVVRTRTLPDDV
ncbi:GAF and ANTAR domain-containing protein [Aeromicrobium sp.]|uniref:GAF and ANTAR domain-containing protein n=1 Tax=Aeromicrobium sp. TaxID=1871063 RepID=UPI0035117BF2